MRFVAYSSKLWTLAILAPILLMGWVWGKLACFRIGFSLEGAIVLVFGLIWALAFLAIVFNLVSGKAAIEIDESGILCYRAYYTRIAWDDVISATRAPRKEMVDGPEGRGVHFSFSEAWRPIDLQIRDLEKYATGRFVGVHRSLVRPFSTLPKPPVSMLRLELSGLSASSEDAMRVIEYYLGLKQKSASLPG